MTHLSSSNDLNIKDSEISESLLSSNKDSIAFSVNLSDVELSNFVSTIEEEVTLYDVSMSSENIEIEGKDRVIFGYLSGIIILGVVGVSFYLYSVILERRKGYSREVESDL
jgi:fumarylacetoacetate (FAA) hydrolase family protein